MNKVSKLCERNAKSSFLVGNSCAPFAIAKPLSLSRRTHCLRTHAPFLFSPMPHTTTTTTNTSLHRAPFSPREKKKKMAHQHLPLSIPPPLLLHPRRHAQGYKSQVRGWEGDAIVKQIRQDVQGAPRAGPGGRRPRRPALPPVL